MRIHSAGKKESEILGKKRESRLPAMKGRRRDNIAGEERVWAFTATTQEEKSEFAGGEGVENRRRKKAHRPQFTQKRKGSDDFSIKEKASGYRSAGFWSAKSALVEKKTRQRHWARKHRIHGKGRGRQGLQWEEGQTK